MTVEPIYITWLNYLGGFEYFPFTAWKEFDINVSESAAVKQNIFPQWPKSYGEFADTIDRQTYRKSKNVIVVRSQNLSLSQVNTLSYIRTSPVVQIVVSRNDRRTVLVDTDSFKKYSEGEKVFTMTFKITFTDQIPSQKI
jgi:hypothetical protein